ncbi:unnamed protein product, partial [Didymodactylos carnosus]
MLKRTPLDEDTIEINENFGKTATVTTVEASKPKSFEYQAFFNEKIEEKKRDNSY